jgi:hypothetical protein
VTFVRTEPAPETVSLLRGLVSEITLAPGSYQVAVAVGPLRFERALQVKAGERVGIDPMLQLGELDLQVVGVAGGPPLDGAVTTIYEDDPDSPQGLREVTRTAGAVRPLLTLPAGSYVAVARLGAAEVRERFSLRSGERVQLTMALEIAQVGVTARVPGRFRPCSTPLPPPGLDRRVAKVNWRHNGGGSLFDVVVVSVEGMDPSVTLLARFMVGRSLCNHTLLPHVHSWIRWSGMSLGGNATRPPVKFSPDHCGKDC